MKRVAITGLGLLSPLGNSVNEFWQNIVDGKSGAGPITKFDASKFKTRFGCEVKGFHPEDYFEKKEIKKYDLFSLYAMAASDKALEDAGLNPAVMTREELLNTGVIWASGNGGIGTFEE